MKYSIVGSGLVGKTLAGIFARHGVEVHIANSRGPASLVAITAELGPHVVPVTVDEALDASFNSRRWPRSVPTGLERL